SQEYYQKKIQALSSYIENVCDNLSNFQNYSQSKINKFVDWISEMINFIEDNSIHYDNDDFCEYLFGFACLCFIIQNIIADEDEEMVIGDSTVSEKDILMFLDISYRQISTRFSLLKSFIKIVAIGERKTQGAVKEFFKFKIWDIAYELKKTE
ncbi:MAG: hypothetical protein MHPSP_003056, partial [Paramarteilia canceri]